MSQLVLAVKCAAYLLHCLMIGLALFGACACIADTSPLRGRAPWLMAAFFFGVAGSLVALLPTTRAAFSL